jgi:Na+/H+ antiporter NhaD/arsenite permease-like protein
VSVLTLTVVSAGLTRQVDINVLFPFNVPVFVPHVLVRAVSKTLSSLRIAAPSDGKANSNGHGAFVRFSFPMNFVTAPLIANLFLLAISATGRTEVHDGIVGANNIAPYDIMIFFLSLAYIALSIDASGLIRYLAYRVLKSGGNAGHRLYLSLYSFFFVLTAAIGNDPIILSGTPFLAYMTRVSANIAHPRAWIYGQFAVANIASAILVSSNPTNLVIAGAFSIRFINYTANVIVPVMVTGVALFPCLLYVVFRDDALVPKRIEMHQLSDEAKEKKPVNPNIPTARSESGSDDGDVPETALPLAEIMNPYMDKVGAIVAASILAVTLVTLLVVNAVTGGGDSIRAFWVTAPAAITTLCFDLVWGRMNRHESRRIANERLSDTQAIASRRTAAAAATAAPGENQGLGPAANEKHNELGSSNQPRNLQPIQQPQRPQQSVMLTTRIAARYRSFRIDFPTASTVLASLPFALVPFAFCMFILVQALVTKGWIPVFAHGWDAWVEKTGTVGAVGGMGFISVILCNASIRFSRTPITDLLTTRLVCWHQYRHRYPSVANRASVAGHSHREWHSHLESHVLGNGLQHGHWRQLRRFQRCLQRVAGGSVVARYPRAQVHPRAQPGLRAHQSSYNRHHYGCRLLGTPWTGLYCQRRFSV